MIQINTQKEYFSSGMDSLTTVKPEANNWQVTNNEKKNKIQRKFYSQIVIWKKLKDTN